MRRSRGRAIPWRSGRCGAASGRCRGRGNGGTSPLPLHQQISHRPLAPPRLPAVLDVVAVVAALAKPSQVFESVGFGPHVDKVRRGQHHLRARHRMRLSVQGPAKATHAAVDDKTNQVRKLAPVGRIAQPVLGADRHQPRPQACPGSDVALLSAGIRWSPSRVGSIVKGQRFAASGPSAFWHRTPASRRGQGQSLTERPRPHRMIASLATTPQPISTTPCPGALPIEPSGRMNFVLPRGKHSVSA